MLEISKLSKGLKGNAVQNFKLKFKLSDAVQNFKSEYRGSSRAASVVSTLSKYKVEGLGSGC